MECDVEGFRRVRFFFFNDTATTEIYTLSLHDALPIWRCSAWWPRCWPPSTPPSAAASAPRGPGGPQHEHPDRRAAHPDRKSTRLNSSHANISYAVFCLKKKNPLPCAPVPPSLTSCLFR